MIDVEVEIGEEHVVDQDEEKKADGYSTGRQVEEVIYENI